MRSFLVNQRIPASGGRLQSACHGVGQSLLIHSGPDPGRRESISLHQNAERRPFCCLVFLCRHLSHTSRKHFTSDPGSLTNPSSIFVIFSNPWQVPDGTSNLVSEKGQHCLLVAKSRLYMGAKQQLSQMFYFQLYKQEEH